MDFFDALSNRQLSRREMLKTSLAAASQAFMPITISEKTRANLQAILPPLVELLKETEQISCGITAADARAKNANYARQDVVAYTRATVHKMISVSKKAQQLLKEHPEAQDIMDAYSSIAPETQWRIAQAKTRIVLDYSPHIDADTREIIDTILHPEKLADVSKEGDRLIKDMENKVWEGFTKIYGSLGKAAWDEIDERYDREVRGVRKHQENLRIEFLRSLGIEWYPVSMEKSLSQAHQFVNHTQSELYLPVHNLRQLADTKTLMQNFYTDHPELNELMNPQKGNTQNPEQEKQKPGQEQEASAETPHETMTEEEFLCTHADHPQVVIALASGNKTYVDRVAKALKIEISR